MNFIDKIIHICSNNKDKIDPKNENYFRAIILNYFSIFSIVILLVASILSFIYSNIILFAFTLAAMLVICLNFLIFKLKAKFIGSAYVFTITYSVLLLWILYSGVLNNQGILLYALFPLFSILLLGKKSGNPISISFFILTGIAILIPVFFNFDLHFSLGNQILYVLIFVAFYILANFLENLLEIKVQELTEEISEAKGETLAKEEFISKISHQIRTPLNNMVVVSNLINSSDVDEKLKDLIDTVQASTNNLVNVVNNIAEISNVDLLQSKDYNQNFNIETTIQNTINLFSNENSQQVNFPLSISNDISYQLYGDPVKIKQVFLNLIENTLKITKSGNKTISIDIKKITESEELAEILFSIYTKDLTNIPEITKIRNTEKTKKGKKDAYIKLMDLNIANKIVESMGGQVEIEISPDNFEFKFTLKFKKGDSLLKTETKETDSLLSEIETAGKVSLKDAHVLLVEDNLINQKIVLLSLKKAVKSVDVANNGKEALDKFGSVKYDVILMDIQMPIMNGIVTTKKIRSIEKSTNSHTPIIAITANALLGDKEECLAAGMDDYISKPFQIETLISKMEKQLS